MTSRKIPKALAKYINQEFRKQSLDQLDSLNPSDIVSFNDDTISENYTIVFRPTDEITQQIIMLQKNLKQIESDHYYYETSQLHATILGDIDIQTPELKIIHAIKTIDISQVKFILFGLGSNGYCSSVSAYPTFDLFRMRTELRELLSTKTDDYSVHLPEYEQMCWINYLRYTHIPSKEFLDVIRGERNKYFGTLQPQTIQVYKNESKVLSREKSQLVYEYWL